MLVVQTITF